MNDRTREDRIVAFLDGEMTEAEATEFERLMERDPELSADVERLAGNDDLLRRAFSDPIDHGVDDALLERMGLAPAKVVAANDDEPWWRAGRAVWGAGIAAALALVATFSLVNGGGAMQPGFDAALDATPSGKFAALDDGVKMQPVLSFKAGDGRWCREFALSGPAGSNRGIACRTGGSWQVAALAAGSQPLPDAEEVVLAEGAESASLDAVYGKLEAGDPIDAATEAELLASGWK